MNYEELKQLTLNTRSTRRFDRSYSVTEEELKNAIDLARISSSAKNMQPLKYITVTSPKMVEQLSLRSKWASHLSNWEQSKDEMPTAFIVILEDSSIDGYASIDLGIATHAIMLGLYSQGLSSCPLGSIDREFCRQEFKLDDRYNILLGIGVGKAKESIEIIDTINQDTSYYRDEKDTHIVPKRTLKNILLGNK